MKKYYEKKSFKIKFINFFAKLAILLSFVAAGAYAAQEYKVLKYYLTFKTTILNSAFILFGVGIFLLIIAKILNKQKNIRFDKQVIKFCINNYVEHEFDLKKIDEMFNYRDNPNITYGLVNALAFRFHKNQTWETIDSKVYNKKHKETGIELIKSINESYATIKTERALSEINETQGIRFRYLNPSEEELTIEEKNKKLIEFEKSFKGYSNTYGEFDVDRLVVTSNSLMYNKKQIASNKNSDYIVIKPVASTTDKKFLISDVIEFYNINDELLLSVDLTLVINGEFFKSIILSVFEAK